MIAGKAGETETLNLNLTVTGEEIFIGIKARDNANNGTKISLKQIKNVKTSYSVEGQMSNLPSVYVEGPTSKSLKVCNNVLQK